MTTVTVQETKQVVQVQDGSIVIVAQPVVTVVEVAAGIWPPRAITADFVVDPAGTGTHTTLQAAIDDVPVLLNNRVYVIFLTPGFGHDATEDVTLLSGGDDKRVAIMGASYGGHEDYSSTVIGTITNGSDTDSGFSFIALVDVHVVGIVHRTGGLILSTTRASIDVGFSCPDAVSLTFKLRDTIIDAIDAPLCALNGRLDDVTLSNITGIAAASCQSLQINESAIPNLRISDSVSGLSVLGGVSTHQPSDVNSLDAYGAWIKLGGPNCTRVQNVLVKGVRIALSRLNSGVPSAVVWTSQQTAGDGTDAVLIDACLVSAGLSDTDIVGLATSNNDVAPIHCSVTDSTLAPSPGNAASAAIGEFDDSVFGPNVPNSVDYTSITGTGNKVWQ